MLKYTHSLTFFLPLIIFILLVLFLCKGLHNHPRKIPSPLINKSIPSFQMPSLKSADTMLTNNIFKNRISLFNVFATWCISCQIEHPVLMDIAHSGDVVIYALDYKDDRHSAQHWLDRYGNPYNKIIFDARGQLAINLGVYGTPETYIIDRRGIIRYKYIGPITQKIWHSILLPEINRLKKEKL